MLRFLCPFVSAFEGRRKKRSSVLNSNKVKINPLEYIYNFRTSFSGGKETDKNQHVPAYCAMSHGAPYSCAALSR